MKKQISLFNGLTEAAVISKGRIDLPTTYNFYFSFRGDLSSHPATREELEFIAENLSNQMDLKNLDLIVGLARGGIPVAVALSYKTEIPYIIAYDTTRKRDWAIIWEEPGAGKYFWVPNLNPGLRVALIDDEVNTGRTYENGIHAMNQAGVTVVEVGSVFEIERKEGLVARMMLSKLGYELRTVGSLKEPVLGTDSIYYFPCD